MAQAPTLTIQLDAKLAAQLNARLANEMEDLKKELAAVRTALEWTHQCLESREKELAEVRRKCDLYGKFCRDMVQNGKKAIGEADGYD